MSALPRSQEPAMPIRAAALFLALTATLPAWAARPAFSPMDVFALEWASDPQISPDGTQVAYVRQSFDIKTDGRRRAIWLVDRDGGGHRPLAGSEAGQASPRWSPDGKRLAFVSADEGGAQIHMVWVAQGVTSRVTNLLDAPAALAWSPDGSRLAFVMRVPEKRDPLKAELPQKPEGAEWAEPIRVIDRMVYRADGEGFLPDAFAQVFVVSADGGTARQLTEGAFDHEGVAWSADGAEILVSANRHDDADIAPANSELYAIDIATGAMRALTDRFGPDAEPAASPDGKYVAYTGFDDAYQGYQRARLYLLRREDGEIRELASDLDRDVENPAWSRDSRRIYFQYDDQGTTRIAECDLSGKVTNIVDDLGGEGWSRPYGGGSFSVARDGTIAYSANDPLDPAQVGLYDGRRSRRLTNLNAQLFANRELGKIEEFWSTASVDGRRTQSWLIRPPGYDPSKTYPLILEIHGGPFANYGPRFAAELQLYASAGYNVLFSNPRGSTSYGEEFGNLIHHAYPGRDFDDLMAAVDAAIARGGVDANRLFVTGGSGGGVLTAWIVGSTDRFRAAAVQKPVINWTSFALTADLPNFFYKYWFPAPPWEDHESYWQRSPLSRVGNVKTPTMVVTGEQDYRTPISESEQFYQALRIRGVDTMLLRVPGAPHALDRRPSQLAARIAYILAWFARHDPASSAPTPATADAAP
jgi:acylaminoacyl-peptidase